jgi:hypothetical protein
MYLIVAAPLSHYTVNLAPAQSHFWHMSWKIWFTIIFCWLHLRRIWHTMCQKMVRHIWHMQSKICFTFDLLSFTWGNFVTLCVIFDFVPGPIYSVYPRTQTSLTSLGREIWNDANLYPLPPFLRPSKIIFKIFQLPNEQLLMMFPYFLCIFKSYFFAKLSDFFLLFQHFFSLKYFVS